MAEKLPAPRLQLRWVEPTPDDLKYPAIKADRDVPEGEHRTWFCHYELIIPLRDTDIRAEDAAGRRVRNELTVPLNRSRRDSCERSPEGMPFRDGAHAIWDAHALDGLPIFVIDIAGNAHRQDPLD